MKIPSGLCSALRFLGSHCPSDQMGWGSGQQQRQQDFCSGPWLFSLHQGEVAEAKRSCGPECCWPRCSLS